MPANALDTDLYQLTMMAGYEAAHANVRATFELFVRNLPTNRAFLVAAGLEQALDFLENLRFTREQIAWLRESSYFRTVAPAFFDRLAVLRFTGDVWAISEGTPVFAYEPLLRVTAPLAEAQLVETSLLSLVTFQTSIASKAARIVWAASGRSVMEFGSRRAHGPEAAVLAARAAYLAGCSSTSNVEAGQRFGIPLAGTMAHSWVTAFPDEIEAFRHYANVFGDRSAFLLDTYDTVEAARRIVASGLRPAAVRLDSGDLVYLSREVRRILDAGGLEGTKIVASGDMDEWSVAHVLAQGAPIDAFGVGTALSTSKDAPALGGVYKLVEVERDGAVTPVMKLSAGGKATYPGPKQVWRQYRGQEATGDVIGLLHEELPSGSTPLLWEVMRGGQRTTPQKSLDEMRQRHLSLVDTLPQGVRMLEPREAYPVSRSTALQDLTEHTAAVVSGDGG
jgi:nicotinate phosphoribosyltransferase